MKRIELKLDDAAKIFRYLHQQSQARDLPEGDRLAARKLAVIVWNAAKLARMEQPGVLHEEAK